MPILSFMRSSHERLAAPSLASQGRMYSSFMEHEPGAPTSGCQCKASNRECQQSLCLCLLLLFLFSCCATGVPPKLSSQITVVKQLHNRVQINSVVFLFNKQVLLNSARGKDKLIIHEEHFCLALSNLLIAQSNLT